MSLIPHAPQSFQGGIEAFYDQYARHVLISPDSVSAFHKQLVNYLSLSDPIYLVRMVKDQVRGQNIFAGNGATIRPTDNSPAWWLHYQLFSGNWINYSSFEQLIESTPCHLFNINLKENANKSGWHIAHIYPAKDRNTDFQHWDQKELKKRMVRNIHPCNYFYIAKQNYQTFGGDPHIVAFFHEKFSRLYADIWEEFLELVEAKLPSFKETANPFVYRYEKLADKATLQKSKTIKEIAMNNSTNTPNLAGKHIAIQYSHTRLCFLRDKIEPLSMDEYFCIHAGDGTYVMSKREFYTTFANVLKTKSYLEDGIYHYPVTPQKAMQLKVDLKRN